MNLRGWTYQTCRAAFRAARKMGSSLLIFEQALAEAIYAAQPPAEYTAAVLAAAMREGHRGPMFLQADHDQVNAGNYAKDPAKETERLSDVIREQIAASFFNIDVDASTVVDLALADAGRAAAAERRADGEVHPAGADAGAGGRHHLGRGGDRRGGRSQHHAGRAPRLHGDVPDGAGRGRRRRRDHQGQRELRHLSWRKGAARTGRSPRFRWPSTPWPRSPASAATEFGLAGAVQHGASTLPMDFFGKFPESGTVEIHLALGFNNLIFDHPRLPQAVKDEIRAYCFTHHAQRAEARPDRGPVHLHDAEEGLGGDEAAVLGSAGRHPGRLSWRRWRRCSGTCSTRMKVGGTDELVARFTQAPVIPVPVPAALAKALSR